jgi:hypothetical protein
LNPDHPVGGPKSVWFRDALGFTRENAGALAKQLRFDPSKPFTTETTPHGTKMVQTIDIVGPNGNTKAVKVVWIRNNDGVLRIVSAYRG